MRNEIGFVHVIKSLEDQIYNIFDLEDETQMIVVDR